MELQTVQVAPLNFVGRIPQPEGRAFPATQEDIETASPILFKTLYVHDLTETRKALDTLAIRKRASTRKPEVSRKSAPSPSTKAAQSFSLVLPNPILTPPFAKRLENKFAALQKELMKPKTGFKSSS